MQISEIHAKIAQLAADGKYFAIITIIRAYGSSPRGGQALVLGAKITALLDGRFNVSFDDVVDIALASLRHRLLLNFEGQASGINTDKVINQLLEAMPREQ